MVTVIRARMGSVQTVRPEMRTPQILTIFGRAPTTSLNSGNNRNYGQGPWCALKSASHPWNGCDFSDGSIT